MKAATILALLSCATLIGAAEPAKESASGDTPLTKDAITAEDLRESMRGTQLLRQLASEGERRQSVVSVTGFRRNCYYMRVTQPADAPDPENYPNEASSTQPRFIPLQSPSQARVRPLVTHVVCSNEGAIRQAAR